MDVLKLAYQMLKDEILDTLLGPALMIFIGGVGLTFGTSVALTTIISALVSGSIYFIAPIIVLYYILPLFYVWNSRKSCVIATKMLEFSMGLIRAVTSCCLYILLFIIIFRDRPEVTDDVILFSKMLAALTPFILSLNVFSKFSIQRCVK